MTRIAGWTITLLMLAAGMARATPRTATREKGSPGDKKSIVKFDADTIDGDLMRPDGDLMAVRPELHMPSLVEPPKSFEAAQRETVLTAADAVAAHREQKINAGGH